MIFNCIAATCLTFARAVPITFTITSTTTTLLDARKGEKRKRKRVEKHKNVGRRKTTSFTEKGVKAKKKRKVYSTALPKSLKNAADYTECGAGSATMFLILSDISRRKESSSEKKLVSIENRSAWPKNVEKQ